LDENIPLDGLEKCISSFQSFYSIHLGEEQIVPTMLVSDLCLASAAASDCLIVDVARLIHIMKASAIYALTLAFSFLRLEITFLLFI